MLVVQSSTFVGDLSDFVDDFIAQDLTSSQNWRVLFKFIVCVVESGD